MILVGKIKDVCERLKFYLAYFGNKKLAWNDSETARLRSQTPFGVAEAMASQWGDHSTEKRG